MARKASADSGDPDAPARAGPGRASRRAASASASADSRDPASPAAARPRRGRGLGALVRGASALALTGGLRALAAGLAVQVESGLPFPAAWALVTVWAIAFAPALLAASLVEMPLRAALAAGPSGRRRRDALASFVLGIAWFALGAKLWPALEAIGPLGGAAIGAAGYLAALLVPASGAREPRGLARKCLALALPTGLAAALLALDPNGRYEARYRDTRAALAALSRARLDAVAPADAGDPRGALASDLLGLRGAAGSSGAARPGAASDAAAAPPAVGLAVADPGALTTGDLADLALARAVAATWMAAQPPERLRWSWEEAVAVEGLLAYAARTGDHEPWAYARAWVDARRAEAEEVTLWADAAAPALAVLALRAAGRGDAADSRLLARIERYLWDEAPRTRLGALSHAGLEGGGALPPMCWVDSLFMHGVYANRLAVEGRPSVRTGSRGSWAIDLAREQTLAQAAHLQDPFDGLFRHAWIETPGGGVRLPVEPCYWARGNGWAAYFVVDYAIARKRAGYGIDPAVEAIARRLLGALLACQSAEEGLWRTDLLGGPAPDNPLETSASALIVAALRRGLAEEALPPGLEDAARAAVARGLPAIRGRVRRHGERAVVVGTSIGTHPGFRAYYRRVRLEDEVGHGVGAVLLALSAGGPR